MIKIKTSENQGLTCVGIGLVALDIILNGSPSTPAKLCAGGSCGNVLSILSFLGWTSKPIARFSNNKATENLFEDLQNFNVDTSLISKSEDGATPIIIHRILKDKLGNPKHKFEFKIPQTNTWLPSFKPVLKSAVNDLILKQSKANVFYFDRVSRSSIDLAKSYKDSGAMIFFEPSSYTANSQFLECLDVADIIKFSNDRIPNYTDLFPEPIVQLEIETLGKDGLKFRRKSNKNRWKLIPSFEIDRIVDSAGAGDWCTAGIINELGNLPANSIHDIDESIIIEALKIGQAFGGLNCKYDGARGLMYNMNYNSFIKSAEAVLNNTDFPNIEASSVRVCTVDNFQFSSII